MKRIPLPDQQGEVISFSRLLITIVRANQTKSPSDDAIQSRQDVRANFFFSAPIETVEIMRPQPDAQPLLKVKYTEDSQPVVTYLDPYLAKNTSTLSTQKSHAFFDSHGDTKIEWLKTGRDPEILLAASVEGSTDHAWPILRVLKRAGRNVQSSLASAKDYSLPQGIYGQAKTLQLKQVSGYYNFLVVRIEPGEGVPNERDPNALRTHVLLPGKINRWAEPQIFTHSTHQQLNSNSKWFRLDVIENDLMALSRFPAPTLRIPQSPKEGNLFGYTFIADPQDRQVRPVVVQFKSKYQFQNFTLVHPKLGALGPNYFFGQIYLGPNRPPAEVIFDLNAKQMILIPGLESTREVQVGERKLLLISGRAQDGTVESRTLTVYDRQTQQFFSPLLNKISLPWAGEDTFQFEDPDFKLKLLIAAPSPFTVGESELDLVSNSDLQQVTLEGPSLKSTKGKDQLHLYVDSSHMIKIHDPTKLAIEGLTPELRKKFDLPEHIDLLREETVLESDNGTEPATRLVLTFQSPDKPVLIYEQTVPGKVDALKFEANEKTWHFVGQSKQDTLTGKIPIQFSWYPSAITKRLLVFRNLRTEPLFEDSDIRFYVSDRHGNDIPRLYFKTESLPDLKEIPLQIGADPAASAEPGGSGGGSGYASLTAMILGNSQQGAGPINQNPVVEIKRDGDVFEIKTQSLTQNAATTYFWSLSQQKLLFFLPNYQKSVDVGPLRFFVGQATPFNNSVVVVVNRQSQQLVTFFDFKWIRLATDLEDFVRPVPEKQQIVFRLEGGLERVYDEATQSFVGFLPSNVLQALNSIEDDLGTTLNTTVFNSAPTRLYEREAELRQLAVALNPQTHDGVPTNTLIVSPSGAGSSILIRDMMSKWISGKLDFEKAVPIVFFRINAAGFGKATKYRGEYADKFERLKSVARSLRSQGYRMVVILEDIQFIDLGDHNFGEGDIFTNLAGLAEDGEVSLISSVSPLALEDATRRSGKFIGQFKNILRLDPLTGDETRSAVQQFLRDAGRSDALNPLQIDGIVSTMKRLSKRALPGAAFDVVASVLKTKARGIIPNSEVQKALSKQSGVPTILLDEENLAENAQKMRDYLNRRVIQQTGIIYSMVNAIFAFAQNINRGEWPVYRALLSGMTGTGKTELARALVEFLFGHTDPLLKINGADYSSSHHVAQLSKKIAEHIEKYPFNVILVDEFEKMDPEARNVLLSLNDGDITAASGRSISSALSIVLATSNMGDEKAKQFIRENKDRMSERELGNAITKIFEDAIFKGLSAPILNRFDKSYVFLGLDREETMKLVADYLRADAGLSTESVARRFARQNIELVFDPSTIEFITDKYRDVEFGGRRLTVRIENDLVRDFLSNEKLSGRLKAGHRYLISVANDKYALAEVDSVH